MHIPGSEPKHYPSLDALRGVAALTVVANHMLIMSARGDNLWWHGSKPDNLVEAAFLRTPLIVLFQGVNAVFLFFVLSGFVLSLPWVRGRSQSYSIFVTRRFFRIYPPYLAAIALSFLLLNLVGHSAVYGASAWYNSIWSGPFDASQLWSMALMDTRNPFMDYPVWTVSWELGIGFIFPILMLPFTRLGPKGLTLSVLAVFVTTIAIRVFGASYAQFGRSACAYILLFLTGAGMAVWVDRLQFQAKMHRTIGIASFVIGILILSKTFPDRPLVSFVPLGVGSSLLIFSALADGPFKNFLMLPFTQWLGKISFSLYLIHVPVITAVVAWGHLPLQVSVLLGALLSFTVAPLFNRLIERPSQQLGRRLTAGQRRSLSPAVN